VKKSTKNSVGRRLEYEAVTMLEHRMGRDAVPSYAGQEISLTQNYSLVMLFPTTASESNYG
jgi:hypothetical protein